MTSYSSWLSVVVGVLDDAWYAPFLVTLPVLAALTVLVRMTAPTVRQATLTLHRRRPVVSPYPGRHVAPPGWKPAPQSVRRQARGAHAA